MKRFYANKYPLKNAVLNGTDPATDLPVGTVFTISGISGDVFELEPVSETKGMISYYVGAKMLEDGFTANDKLA
jgi:hypothetical protein